MATASEGKNSLLQKMHINAPAEPFVGNVNADVLSTGEEVYGELRDQLTHGVLWQKSIEKMRDRVAEMFKEIGPGNVLTKLVRRID
jgi:malonyl CoA-acyl carrier protein transacylase